MCMQGGEEEVRQLLEMLEHQGAGSDAGSDEGSEPKDALMHLADQAATPAPTPGVPHSSQQVVPSPCTCVTLKLDLDMGWAVMVLVLMALMVGAERNF